MVNYTRCNKPRTTLCKSSVEVYGMSVICGHCLQIADRKRRYLGRGPSAFGLLPRKTGC